MNTKAATTIAKNKIGNKKGMKWNLKLLYQSPDDPQIEKDVAHAEKATTSFAKKYGVANKSYVSSSKALLKALSDYETLLETASPKPLIYFYFLRDIEAGNPVASAHLALLEARFAKQENQVAFFALSLGKIPKDTQKILLMDKNLAHFRVMLSRIFADASHDLSVPEERIMNLKSIPAYNMWISGNERMLSQKTVDWKQKKIPLAQALGTVQQLTTQKERAFLSQAIVETLKEVAPFSEAEINAIVTNKKINDELRSYATPYEQTVNNYRNDPKVVATLVKTVTEAFPLAHRFHAAKAKLLKAKKLNYADRAAKIGTVTSKFDFEASRKILDKIYTKLGPYYRKTFSEFLSEKRIDAYPRLGKKSGAYCWGSYSLPTFVLLNHTDDLHSFTTIAHEMGHAFHTELSKSQGMLYHDYSIALAETASTLFESIALEHVYDSLPEKEKIIVLHDKINDDIATIFRQIACFNFELDIHMTIRSKGYVSQQKLAELHNKNMAAYLGKKFDLMPDDGYFFVQWSHIRRFFYVYSYAFGMLVSKALLRRYKADPTFWKSIEKFLSAGGKDSPENILMEIGIDVRKPDFFKEGLKEIESDIAKLESLIV